MCKFITCANIYINLKYIKKVFKRLCSYIKKFKIFKDKMVSLSYKQSYIGFQIKLTFIIDGEN